MGDDFGFRIAGCLEPSRGHGDKSLESEGKTWRPDAFSLNLKDGTIKVLAHIKNTEPVDYHRCALPVSCYLFNELISF